MQVGRETRSALHSHAVENAPVKAYIGVGHDVAKFGKLQVHSLRWTQLSSRWRKSLECGLS